MRKSRIVTAIKEKVNAGEVPETFSVENFPDILEKSPAFLSKHRIGNPGGYNPYFERVEPGKYKLLEH